LINDGIPDVFTIAAVSPGRLEARGDLSYETAVQALKAGIALIQRDQTSTIDMSKVSEADSAGLAVLVEWLATARARNAVVRYEGIPAQILTVARISELDDLLTAH
jgi:phospholipid transport system transporter-binding protein